MRRVCLSILLILGVLVSPAAAVEIKVTEDLLFTIELAQGWSLHIDQAPEALVKEMASHVAHEPAAANATKEQIESVARKRLEANEAIVYHAESGAHLDIDFSPLGQGESAPSSRTLKNSAKYAAQSLENEEDVADVDWDVKSFEVEGAHDAFLLTADYSQHDHPMKFLGVIGYADNSWFFLYYTAPGKNPATLGQMQTMLDNATVRIVE